MMLIKNARKNMGFSFGGICTFAILLCVFPILVHSSENGSGLGHEHESVSSAPDDGGLRVLRVNNTASNYMIDLRFQLTDSKNSGYFTNRKNRAFLIHEASGKVLQVPVSSKLGPMRQAPKFPSADKIYFVLFANPARIVSTGDKVTLVIGDYRQTDIIVE